MSIETDVVIIGAGPCGLFQIFELGLLDLKAHIIDALTVPGGQCAELYPDKPIYDIPGFPIVGAQELVDRLLKQAEPFKPTFHLGEQVQLVQKQEDGRFRIVTAVDTELLCKAVIIAAGVGAFQPVMLRLEGIERFQDTQIFYKVRNPAQHQGKKVVVLGGGDSALDWALQMVERGSEVTLIHRSPQFRAAPASINKFQDHVNAGKAKLILGQVLGYGEKDGRLATLNVTTTDQQKQLIEVDDLLIFFGLSPKLGPIAEWSLALNKNQIPVDTEKFQTSIPGIYAVGDINTYPGKKKLILSGFHETALAAFAIKHQLFPNEKIHLQYTTTSPSVHKKLGVPD